MDPIPDPAFVWLVGPSGSGKSTWAAAHYRPGEVFDSDLLRASVGHDRHDLDASADAFAVLELAASARLRRGLTTVVDTLGTDQNLRRRLAAVATAAGLPVVAVAFAVEARLAKHRNASREVPVPARVIDGQYRRHGPAMDAIRADGWQVVDIVDAGSSDAAVEPGRTAEPPSSPEAGKIEIHLHVGSFSWIDWEQPVGPQLATLARTAEDVGFAGISFMDHLVQIPQVGRRWDPILDPLVAMASAAAATERLRIAPLVLDAVLRTPAVVAKTLATVDVLSGGRVDCGVGAGWFADEVTSHGMAFPRVSERMAVLEETVGALRALWGPGAKPFHGDVIRIDDTTCYPRPVQDPLPIIVGGNGERRTLGIVAAHADGCNLTTSDPDTVRRKLAVLDGHCRRVERDPSTVLRSVLDVAVTGDRTQVASGITRLRGRQTAAQATDRFHAGPPEHQIARYRLLASLGVDRVYLSPADLAAPSDLDRWAPVIAGIRR